MMPMGNALIGQKRIPMQPTKQKSEGLLETPLPHIHKNERKALPIYG